MFLNYLKITFRNFLRQKGFYFLNILGLSIGIACSILIVLFVNYELDYDKYNENHNRIFRMAVDGLAGNTEIYQTYTPAPLPQALYSEFPEIEKITRIATPDEVLTKWKDKTFNENGVFLVDSTFFDVFTIKALKGNRETALAEPFSVVITEETAGKYFGDTNPLNEVMTLYVWDDTLNLKVTAVVKEVPEQSHFHFDFLVSLTSIDGLYNGTSWWWNNFRCYLLLYPDVDYKTLEAKFGEFTIKYLFEGRDYDELAKSGNKWEYYLQPLTEIHLTSDIAGEFEPNGNKNYIYIFMVIAVFILAMACINFMNLSTAKSTRRAREVGIRKVSGATKSKLINQFLSESILISLI
ncbi:MAG: ABC transporter permease, partial [Bacteroidales bacterium]|nr:ABC transporter permease [Bacteroidales bacterium]